jgi:hypothetical protein
LSQIETFGPAAEAWDVKSGGGTRMDDDMPAGETYNPWTIVNAVFHQLADAGLHPVLGTAGDPGEAAAALLLALGIRPSVPADAPGLRDSEAELAKLRQAAFGDP